MARGTSPVQDPQEIGTFETLVQEEQSLKERMQARLNEIMPAVQEAENIKQWLGEHMAAQNGATPAASAPSSAPARSDGNQGGGQRKKRGQVREEFLTVVRKHPEGVTVADVAKELGRPPAYYYRIAGKLKEDKVIADAPNGNGVVAA